MLFMEICLKISIYVERGDVKMFYANKNQEKVKELINKFGCIRSKQIESITGLKDLDKLMEPIIKQWNSNIKKETDLYFIKNGSIRERTLKALELYAFLSTKGTIEWCEPVDFPFELSLFMNNKVFDIAVIEEGEEIIYTTAIERSIADRVIIIIDKEEQKSLIRLTKKHKICIWEPNIKFL